jgi:hypothetical protein
VLLAAGAALRLALRPARGGKARGLASGLRARHRLHGPLRRPSLPLRASAMATRQPGGELLPLRPHLSSVLRYSFWFLSAQSITHPGHDWPDAYCRQRTRIPPREREGCGGMPLVELGDAVLVDLDGGRLGPFDSARVGGGASFKPIARIVSCGPTEAEPRLGRRLRPRRAEYLGRHE